MKKNKTFAIVLAVVLLVPIIYFAFIHEKKLPRPELKNVRPLTEPTNHNYSFENPPKFKKEGELSFIKKKDSELISSIDIEIADNNHDRAMGLMFRESMQESNGMLFVFEREEFQAFWMRNTLISLDIIYADAKGNIVDIYESTQTRSTKSLPSKSPAMYVVEVNAGYCKQHNIGIGDRIEFR